MPQSFLSRSSSIPPLKLTLPSRATESSLKEPAKERKEERKKERKIDLQNFLKNRLVSFMCLCLSTYAVSSSVYRTSICRKIKELEITWKKPVLV
jgi:hypothetical protein